MYSSQDSYHGHRCATFRRRIPVGSDCTPSSSSNRSHTVTVFTAPFVSRPCGIQHDSWLAVSKVPADLDCIRRRLWGILALYLPCKYLSVASVFCEMIYACAFPFGFAQVSVFVKCLAVAGLTESRFMSSCQHC